MTRGRTVTQGVEDAILTARTRGCVMKFYSGPESVCNLMIRTSVHLIFVRVKRVVRILCTLKEIEEEHRDLIVQLRSFPVSGLIIRELWIYSKHGTYRYFRVGDAGIEEIDWNGIPVKMPEEGLSPAGGTVTGGGTGNVFST